MNEMGVMIATHIPALVMMIVGYALLVVEMYIPGFGLPGISGIVLMSIGIIAMKPTPLQALLLVLIAVLLLSLAFSIAMRSISKGRLSRSNLVLNDEINGGNDSENADLSYFVGKTGRTHTALRPAGIAEFDGVKLNVVSDGDFINTGCPVRVECVEGNRIVVREISE